MRCHHRLAAALVLSLLAIAPAVDASRYIPSSLDPPLEPQLSTLELLAEYEPPEPSPFELLGFEEHLIFTLGIFLEESELEALNAARTLRPLTSDRPLENALRGVWAEKLASGVKSSESTTISLELKPLNLELHRGHQMATLDGRFPGGQNLLFQGLWTDPVTGLSYARNRWYDARNASWLSEDPVGAVDSTNLYAFVGWAPHVGRDPMGLVTEAQMKRYMKLLRQASRNSRGYHGERVLERVLEKSGRTILQGPVTSGKGVNQGGADIISYNPETQRIELWDHKFLLPRGNSTSRNVSSVPTFTKPERLAANLDTAAALIEKSDLPNKVELLADLASGEYDLHVAGVGPGNTVSGVTQRLKDAGIKFAEPEFVRTGSEGSKGPGIGRRVLKGVGVAGLIVGITQYASEAAAGIEEDAEYRSWVSELQATCEECEDSWLVGNSSLIRSLGKSVGEEVGGNIGAGVGAGAAALLCAETGPGAIACAIGGGLAGGMAGDEVGGRAGGGAVDLMLDLVEDDDADQ
ncbi:MAG: RHS repeat-associated core domain-containing protein [bacterium]|nr:RHS repeat-associated core domain-containing protein [bacterium]